MNTANKRETTIHPDSALLLEQARAARRQYVRESLSSAWKTFARMFRAAIRSRENHRTTAGYEVDSFYRNQP